MEAEFTKHISITRLRLGVFLFIIWWIPIYLTIPFLDTVFDANSQKEKHIIAILILTIQGIVGLVGLLLVGKQLALTLKRIKYKKLPITVWRLLWTGDTDINPDYLKSPKKKLHKKQM